MKKLLIFIITVTVLLLSYGKRSVAQEPSQTEQRMLLYQAYALETHIPWYIIGAIDQYERNTKNYRSYCPKEDEIISICFEPKVWSGLSNPNPSDRNLSSIQLFQGLGVDGDGDGYADRLNPRDRLEAFMRYVSGYGFRNEKLEEALFDYYHSEKGVEIIFTIAKLFEKYQTIELSRRVFPIPRYYAADYTNNYGTGRSYGGYRIHEGVDIFSHYGTPVVSTAYGVVEIIGWNRFGGYRIGIRDMYNTYQYYAHLTGYAKGIKEGDIVEPGQVIGYVGSTGYGKEGTSGKFPPHLHFGFYKYDGRKEWSFNPYIYIRKWERIRLR